MSKNEGDSNDTSAGSSLTDHRNLQSRQMILEIANDFNNLLVGIIGNARFLLEEKFVKPAGAGLVSEIIGCAERCTRLVSRLQILERPLEVPQLQINSVNGQPNSSPAMLAQALLHTNEEGHIANTVLVIDDEEVVRNVSSAILERAGYNVIATASGQEGIAIFEANRDIIHSVLLDLTMPYIRGNLVFAKLKAIDPDVKVFLMSGYSDQQIMREFRSEGVAGLIKKPFEAEHLLQALGSVNAAHAPPRSAA